MKYTTIYLDENKIELYNTLLGKESIKVNGEIVSEKRSITGTDHHFKIIENEIETPCKLTTGFGMNGIVFSLYKNGKPVIESPKNSSSIFLIFIIIGAIVGYGIISRMI